MKRKIITAILTISIPLSLSACFQEGPNKNFLRVAMNFQPIAGFSPYTEDATILTRTGVSETLVSYRDGVIRPHIASSFRMLDDHRAEFSLPPGIVFHDGTPVDASAVSQSLNHAFQASVPPKSVAQGRYHAEAQGDHRVLVVSDKPDPILIQRFSDPGLAILSPLAYDNPESPNPVNHATGPFRITDASRDKLETHRNDNYYGSPAALERVEYRFIPHALSRVNVVESGGVDVAVSIPVSRIEDIQRHRELSIHEVPLHRGVYLHLNSRGVLAAPELREAVAQAVDTTIIAEGIYEGKVLAGGNSIYSPEEPWSQKGELLPDGGSEKVQHKPEATTVKSVTGKGQKITLATWLDRPELPEIATVIADSLRKQGFEVDTVVSEYKFLETGVLNGKYDLVIGNRNYLLNAGDPLISLRSDYSCQGKYNLSQYCRADIDSAITAAADDADPTRRLVAAADIGRAVVEDHAVVPVVFEKAFIAANRRVQGLAEDPFENKLITTETRVESSG